MLVACSAGPTHRSIAFILLLFEDENRSIVSVNSFENFTECFYLSFWSLIRFSEPAAIFSLLLQRLHEEKEPILRWMRASCVRYGCCTDLSFLSVCQIAAQSGVKPISGFKRPFIIGRHSCHVFHRADQEPKQKLGIKVIVASEVHCINLAV